MVVRLTYRSEVYVTADTIEEARNKFEDAILVSEGTKVEGVSVPEFVEIVSVEDADTYEDLWTKYYHC